MELAYGVIPLQLRDGKWYTFIIHRTKSGGFWEFPKGHLDEGETQLQAAERELKEETGLELMYLVHKEPLVESYRYEIEGDTRSKQVYYYLAIVQGEVQLQRSEVDDGKWVPLEEAVDHVTYETSRSLCEKVVSALATLGSR
ncbi:MAG: putative mutator protein MutT4 [Chlamydiae bacterium]|nr:putative mutator protein MutT4 [Chlamydiota bacterium]